MKQSTKWGEIDEKMQATSTTPALLSPKLRKAMKDVPYIRQPIH